MNTRSSTHLLVGLLVVAAVVLSFGMAAAIAETTENTPDDPTDENASVDVAPGEQMAGVIGVQSAEIDGEVSDRTFGVKVAQAATNESAADAVAERLAEVEERIEANDKRLAELEEARENGSISEGQYRAEVAKTAAENANAERAVDQANETAGELPEAVLEERGINTSAIQTLKHNASELSGPETAAIAQSIAGPSVGERPPVNVSPGAPDDVGAPDDAGPGNQTGAPDDAGPGNQTGAPDDGADNVTEDADDAVPDEEPADVADDYGL